MTDWSTPSWSNMVRKLRDDVNALAWLTAEEREIQRLYMETFVWAITGRYVSVEEFAEQAKQMGFGVADKGPADDAEQSAAGALERSQESES
jgi:hypothetical protein